MKKNLFKILLVFVLITVLCSVNTLSFAASSDVSYFSSYFTSSGSYDSDYQNVTGSTLGQHGYYYSSSAATITVKLYKWSGSSWVYDSKSTTVSVSAGTWKHVDTNWTGLTANKYYRLHFTTNSSSNCTVNGTLYDGQASI